MAADGSDADARDAASLFLEDADFVTPAKHAPSTRRTDTLDSAYGKCGASSRPSAPPSQLLIARTRRASQLALATSYRLRSDLSGAVRVALALRARLV